MIDTMTCKIHTKLNVNVLALPGNDCMLAVWN